MTYEGLNETDVRILNAIMDDAFASGNPLVSADGARAAVSDLSDQEYVDSLRVLDEEGYIHCTKVIGRALPLNVIPSLNAFLCFVRANRPADDEFSDVAAAIIAGARTLDDVQERVSLPRLLVKNYILLLEADDLVELAETPGGGVAILDFSPRLKRRFLKGD